METGGWSAVRLREYVQELRTDGLKSIDERSWPEAVARWSLCLAIDPDDGEAWGLTILCCREAGWFEEAECIGQLAVRRFPTHWRVLTEWSLLSFAKADWVEASKRWSKMRDVYPDDVHALLRSAGVAEELGQFDDAANFLRLARSSAKESGWSMVDSARFFERRGDLKSACDMWRRVMVENNDVDSLTNLCRCLNLRECFSEVEELIRNSPKFADHPESLMVEHARAAAGQADWKGASQRWQHVVDHFPMNGTARDGLGEALWHGQVSEGIERQEHSAVAPTETSTERSRRTEALSTKSLMMCFESLGDNCEFGLVQRHFGAEPIGLYRWAGVSTQSLIDAIHARFEGMGEPENTELQGRIGEEYVVRDRRNWLISHTFVPYDEARYPKILERQTAVLRFLSDRLLQDLTESWKVFVFKPRDGVMRDEEMFALKAAMQAVGDSALLCVRVLGEASETGSVQRLARGLYRGDISKVSVTARAAEIDYNGWLDLCSKAAELATQDEFKVGAE